MPPKKSPAKNAPTKKSPAAVQSPDLALIRSLAEILNDTGLSEIELDQRGMRVRVSKGGVTAQQVHVPVMQSASPTMHAAHGGVAAPESKPVASPEAEHAGTVKSPMVGTAYLAPSPGAQRFVDIGQQVKQGQTLLIIEAMKTMNQIHSPAAGKVIAIHVDNGDPVEFGAPLVTIE